MKKQIYIWLFTVLLFVEYSHGQGLVQITFDGPPVQSPGTATLITNYSEAGMSFTPIDLANRNQAFVRQGGAVSFYPEDGTTYLQAGFGSTLMFRYTNGSVFS